MARLGSRKTIFPVLLVMFTFALLVIVLVFAEVLFSSLKPYPFIAISPPYRRDYPRLKQTPFDPKTHVAIHLPPPKYPDVTSDKIWRFEGTYVPVNIELPPGFNRLDPDVGSTANKGVWRSRALTPDGIVAFDASYGIDDWSRRVTVNEGPHRRSKPMVLMGCSFTFGLGLNDQETLPSALAKRLEHYYVYNYAFFGWGLGNNLRRISRPSFKEELPQKKGGIAIYGFTDAQMARSVGNLGLTRMVPTWRTMLPNYYLDGNDQLQSSGMLSDGRPWQTLLFDVLAKSSTLNYFKIDIPPRYSKRDFKLLAAMFKRMKQILVDEMGFEDFYVLFYPEQGLAGRLIEELNEVGIQTIDYSEVIWDAYAQPAHIPLEIVHPTAAAQDFLAEQIIRDLNLN